MKLLLLFLNQLLADGVSILFISGKTTFIKDPRYLPGNPPDCIFYKVMIPMIYFYHMTCTLINNNLYGKLVSLFVAPLRFCNIFRVTPVSFFVAGFNLQVVNLRTLRLHFYIESFYTFIISNQSKFTIPSRFLVKNTN